MRDVRRAMIDEPIVIPDLSRDQAVAHYSDMQRRAFALVQALAADPAVIVADILLAQHAYQAAVGALVRMDRGTL